MSGNIIVAGGCLHLYIIDTVTCQQITIDGAHKNWIFYVKILDGKIISCSKTTIKIWNLKSGESLKLLQGHVGPVICLDVSKNMVASAASDKTIKIWEISTGTCLSTFNTTNEVSCIKIYNQMIFSGVANKIEMWDISSGKCTQICETFSPISCIFVADDVIISGTSTGDVQIWDKNGKCCFNLNHEDKMRSIMVLDDNTIVSVSSDNSVKMWKGVN